MSVRRCKIQVWHNIVIRAAFFPRVILIGCNKLLLSNAFPLTAAACQKRCTACSAPSTLNEVVKSVSQTQVLRKRAIAAFPGRQKQNCVASLKSQVQAPQALLGLQKENFKVYNSYYYYHRLYKPPYGGLQCMLLYSCI